MIIGCLKEIKDNENRVGLTPAGCKKLTENGHHVLVQAAAGMGAGFSDKEYSNADAELINEAGKIVQNADIIVKVKEPLEEEYELLELMKGKTLFTYLHLSGVDPELTNKLLENKITAVAYETVEDSNGRLPLLSPMSEIAGVLAIQYGGEYLQKKYGGRGITLGTIRNTDQGHVVIVGGGFVGQTAAKAAAGLGARVTLFDIRDEVVKKASNDLKEFLGPNLGKNIRVLKSEEPVFSETLKTADVLIGAVLVAGTKAPIAVKQEHIKLMPRGSIVIDVSIDQGGCIWGSHPTTHSNPIFNLEEKIYCCVANMPGQVARQSTQALTSATLPYLLKMADDGVMEVMRKDKGLLKGLNTHDGFITYKSVAEDLGLPEVYKPAEETLLVAC